MRAVRAQSRGQSRQCAQCKLITIKALVCRCALLQCPLFTEGTEALSLSSCLSLLTNASVVCSLSPSLPHSLSSLAPLGLHMANRYVILLLLLLQLLLVGSSAAAAGQWFCSTALQQLLPYTSSQWLFADQLCSLPCSLLFWWFLSKQTVYPHPLPTTLAWRTVNNGAVGSFVSSFQNALTTTGHCVCTLLSTVL